MLVEANLSKDAYCKIRNYAMANKFTEFFPAYNRIVDAKSQCFPSSISYNDLSIKVDPLDLIKFTIVRLLKSIGQSFVEGDYLAIEAKIGFDGSQSASMYNFKSQTLDIDNFFCVCSLLPLQLSLNGSIV